MEPKIAGKDHKCDACKRTILRGRVYIKQSKKGFKVRHFHEECYSEEEKWHGWKSCFKYF